MSFVIQRRNKTLSTVINSKPALTRRRPCCSHHFRSRRQHCSCRRCFAVHAVCAAAMPGALPWPCVPAHAACASVPCAPPLRQRPPVTVIVRPSCCLPPNGAFLPPRHHHHHHHSQSAAIAAWLGAVLLSWARADELQLVSRPPHPHQTHHPNTRPQRQQRHPRPAWSRLWTSGRSGLVAALGRCLRRG